MTAQATNDSGEFGDYTIQHSADRATVEITATGENEQTAIASVLTGVVAAITGHTPPQPTVATYAVPLRADSPDIASLTLALAESLLDILKDDPTLVGPIRLDGILRTDEGLTAWGYMLSAKESEQTLEHLAIVRDCVTATNGAITIQLDLVSKPEKR